MVTEGPSQTETREAQGETRSGRRLFEAIPQCGDVYAGQNELGDLLYHEENG